MLDSFKDLKGEEAILSHFQKALDQADLREDLEDLAADTLADGYIDRAIKMYQQLNQLSAQSSYHLALAQAYTLLGLDHEADKYLAQLDLVDLSASQAYELGRIYQAQKDLSKAKDVFQEIIVEDPVFYQAYLALAEVYQDLGDSARSQFYLETLQEYFIQEEIQVQVRPKLLALYFQEPYQHLEKIQQLLFSGQSGSARGTDYLYQSYYYDLMDQAQESLEAIQQAEALDPEDLRISIQKLRILYRLKDVQGAYELNQTLLETLPDADPLLMDILDLGVDQGARDEKFLDRLQNSLPFVSDVDTLYSWVNYLLEAYIHIDALVEAVDLLEDALDQGALPEYLALNAARLYAKRQETETALYYYQEAFNYQWDPEWLEEYAGLLLEKQKMPQVTKLVDRYSQYFSREFKDRLKKEDGNELPYE